MITRDTVVVGVAPRIGLLAFKASLDVALSPARFEAEQIYNIIVAQKVDPAFLLAIFRHESMLGLSGLAVANKNPGNTRSSLTGTGIVVDTVKGKFVRYPTWTAGFEDLAVRLVAPYYVYWRKGLVTIAQIIPVFAPDFDGNDPEAYTANVVKLMNTWIGESSNNKMALKIALAAGHHNSDGGSQVEAAITGPLCHFYAMAFRETGCDVRVITPDDGLGQYPGGLQDVAAKVVEWANAGWVADLFLECHTQGLGDTSVRGCFAIYPDWGGDTDIAVRDGLGLRMVKAISGATGIPVWSRGVMSEKSTGVGISGFRLGIFLRTAPIAAKTTRLIVEHGAHTNPQDLTLLQSPPIQQKIAQAGAKAVIDYFGGIKVAPDYDPCMDYFNAHGGEAVFGKPIGGQHGSTPGAVEREFEFAHMYLDKATGKVIAQMKDRTNPQGFKVGPGIYGKCKEHGLKLVTNEMWFSPDPGQPGLGKMSRAWAQDSSGVTVVIMASELIELAKPGEATPWKVEVLEVK
jgi:N-acetylmuramoyl-L-alanine amidase